MIVGNNQHYTAGEIKDWSVVYMGSSCKRTQFALLKDKSGVVHKYDFGDDTRFSRWSFPIGKGREHDSSL